MERQETAGSVTLREQLIRDEEVRLSLYYLNGIPHIGVGHNLSAKAISARAADVILADDMNEAIRQVAYSIPWSVSLDEARLGALQAMAFTMGIGGLMGFRRMLTALEVFDYEAAAREVLDSAWATKAGQDHARARRIAEQIRTGQWQ